MRQISRIRWLGGGWKVTAEPVIVEVPGVGLVGFISAPPASETSQLPTAKGVASTETKACNWEENLHG
nr:hypothetical protein Itr_chr03CG22970 [Ipomoea trifida]